MCKAFVFGTKAGCSVSPGVWPAASWVCLVAQAPGNITALCGRLLAAGLGQEGAGARLCNQTLGTVLPSQCLLMTQGEVTSPTPQ